MSDFLRMSINHSTESEQSGEVEGYGKALARIKSRVSEKHILYPLLEKYFQNKALVVLIGGSKADKIYGNNINILYDLFSFLTSCKDYAPAMLKKLADMKDYYGNDEKQFRKLASTLYPALKAFEISSQDLRLASSEADMQSAQKFKEEILIIIGKLKQDLQRVPKKNKSLARGLPDMDIKKYECEIRNAIAKYLKSDHVLSEIELQEIIGERKDAIDAQQLAVLQIRQETRHNKDKIIGKTL